MTLVALDFDRESIRVACAEARSGEAQLTHAAAFEPPGEGLGDRPALAEKLRDALPDVRWSRAKLTVALGGDQVAFRLLKLPPMPDAELPDMVALLADKEFGAAEPGVVDYLPLRGDETTQRTILAARVRQSTLSAITKLAEELDTTLQRVVIRACGAASLAARIDSSVNQGLCLVGASAGKAADLVALADGVPMVIRTARGMLSADGSEVRRTLSTASLQAGQPVKRVELLGGNGQVGQGLSLVRLASEGWKLPQDQVDLVEIMPGTIGVALDEADSRTPEFDLLNPRRAEADTSPRRRQIMLAGLTAAVLLLGVGLAYLKLVQLDSERKHLEADRELVINSTEQFQPYADQAAEIEQWLASDMNWLDEFELLGRQLRPMPLDNKDFPADGDVMLTQFTATATGGRSGAGGQIVLEAVARNVDSPTDLEQRLRQDRIEVQQGSLDQSGTRPYYWRFKPTMKIRSAPKPVPEKPDPPAATDLASGKPTTEGVQ